MPTVRNKKRQAYFVKRLSNRKNIQCIVRRTNRDNFIKFGEAQKPNLWTYADNIDTVDFLSSL